MIDIEKARALVETLKDYAEHPSSFTDISPTEADAAADLIAALLDEVERLNSPVVLSEWQKLVTERDALARDAARFNWYFGRTGKESVFVGEYMRGIREGWTPDQWRAAIDAAMSEKTP
jgi:hypothetical protein